MAQRWFRRRILVWDHNRDGLITDNSELMSEYDKTGKAACANGYEKLARYFDKDKNGVIEGSELNDLHFWVDDGDAVTEAGELRTPASYGITQIVIPGNAEQKSSTFTKESRSKGAAESDASGYSTSREGFGKKIATDMKDPRTTFSSRTFI